MNRGYRVLKMSMPSERRDASRKENRKTLIRGTYELIGLDLSKVWIDSEIKRQSRTRCELRCQSGIKSDRLIHDAARIGDATGGVNDRTTCRSEKVSDWESL